MSDPYPPEGSLRREMQEKAALALSYFLDVNPLDRTSCFDMAGAVLDAVQAADGKLLMPSPRDAVHDWTYGWHEMDDNCWPVPELRFDNVLEP